jgi:hypothetical protein
VRINQDKGGFCFLLLLWMTAGGRPGAQLSGEPLYPATSPWEAALTHPWAGSLGSAPWPCTPKTQLKACSTGAAASELVIISSLFPPPDLLNQSPHQRRGGDI